MEYLQQVVTDALTWEALKHIAKLALGVVLMTGAGQYLLQNVFNRLKKRQEKISYWIGAPILLFVFLLFISTNESPRQGAPELRGQIEAVHVNDNPITTLLLIAGVGNTGSMPSVATGWSVTIMHDGKGTDCPVQVAPEKFIINFAARGTVPARSVTYYGKDSLLTKTLLSPIAPGSLTSGILLCEFHDLDYKSLHPTDKIVLSFVDVFSKSIRQKYLLSLRFPTSKFIQGLRRISNSLIVAIRFFCKCLQGAGRQGPSPRPSPRKRGEGAEVPCRMTHPPEDRRRPGGKRGPHRFGRTASRLVSTMTNCGPGLARIAGNASSSLRERMRVTAKPNAAPIMARSGLAKLVAMARPG
jgi:hypothetical protein